MNLIIKKEIADTLDRFQSLLENSPLLKKLSHLVEIKSYVVGGAIRDLVLDKPIKDIDIFIQFDYCKDLNVLSINKTPYRSKYLHDMDEYQNDMAEQQARADALDLREKEIFKVLSEDDFYMIKDFLTNTKIKNNEITATDLLISLVEYILKQDENYHIQEVFNRETKSDAISKISTRDVAYTINGLGGVIKLEDKQSNYPVELLFSTSNIYQFQSLFDFNLCKVHLTNEDGEIKIIKDSYFEIDVKNKEFTYTPPREPSESNIKKSLINRYNRLYPKYSDYNLTFDSRYVNSQEIKELIEQMIISINMHNKLSKLTENNKNIISKTKKI